ncbi:paired amphipathic helix repeat-containing protein [Nitzschia inconspicua]|uniref:Paired amphipathic helix repeat-containing protein n=1 Tax=Nitzschia inconspicua TaxID=303405 RepID=A0A9K3LRZ1_9STRA|nr:paired amphipathic helix repeat-containing protein [Nitzschia inconspicua]
MFPPPQDSTSNNTVNNEGTTSLPANGGDTNMLEAGNNGEHSFANPSATDPVDTDSTVTEADDNTDDNAPPGFTAPTDNSHDAIAHREQQAQQSLQVLNDSIEDRSESQQFHPAQPPLGRNASAGDTQPRLGNRQDSVGIQLHFPTPASHVSGAISNQQLNPTSVKTPALDMTKSTSNQLLFGSAAPSVPSRAAEDPSKMEVTEAMATEEPKLNSHAPPVSSLEVSHPVEECSVADQPFSSVPSAGNSHSSSHADTPAAVGVGPSLVHDGNSSALISSSMPARSPPEIKGYPVKSDKVLESCELKKNSSTLPANSGVTSAILANKSSTFKLQPFDTSQISSESTANIQSAASSTPANGASVLKEESTIEDKPKNTIPVNAPTFNPAEMQNRVTQHPPLIDDRSTAKVPESVTSPLGHFALPKGKNGGVTLSNQSPSTLATSKQVVLPERVPTASLGVSPPQLHSALTPNTATVLHGAPPSGFVSSVNTGAAKNIENGSMIQQHGPLAGAPPQRPPAGGPFGGMKELRVEDALLYLDDVKREFGDRPRIYNEFLAIMKNFKSQEVDTPGVIARVSKLFRGYNNLILGFNKFLPDGFKISMEDLKQQDAAYAREQEILRQQQLAMEAKAQQLQREQQGSGVPMMGAMGMGLPGSLQQSPPHSVVPPQQQLQMQQLDNEEARQQQLKQSPSKLSKQAKPNSAKGPKGRKPQQGPVTQLSQPPPVQHQAVEFDHAISYVTTIKRRFANDPGTYHAFLEILHTYQKEQRGIKEVLEQVAHLFQDHPDLLKEFTFFLPDAVQEQAKERLHRAAAESESRLSAIRAKKEQGLSEGDSQQVIDMTRQPMMIDGDAQGRKRPFHDVNDAPQPIVFPQTPESYVYNAAVERQFFDAAKEALASYTRDGGQAWAEFMKCLDMYAQEILSRNEMLNFVEPLLGKRNSKLFEEFKRILAAAGGRGTSTAPPMEDSWYSVPLSEIDFSRCRRCSPSYRALPRDYPAPPCSQRSDEEAKVLNDVWVSLPVGSEESYTFRHMRRNTYEETLFRCEDERFEIDMAIDSNLCTLAVLEPFAEELAVLSANELQIQVDIDSDPKPAAEQNGLGGKLIQYTFDPKILGVIHRNSIVRIYGEQGTEMLELLKNNPSVAIPIVVRRLRQKDKEWQRVRDRLNRHWKELAEHNYYKSLDHRSLTWRTTDKKAISTRTLISEIKDRAANNGNEGQAALQARIDKAKEEHGSFYEVTMAKALRSKPDLSNLPKPDRRLFTPHMSLLYENNTWVQRDAYRILSFALERGSISPTDKERCHRLWTEFLGPWFNVSLNWMLSPAVSFLEFSALNGAKPLPRIVSQGRSSPVDDEEESLDDGDSNPRISTEDVQTDRFDEKFVSSIYYDHHPLPVGSTVSTVYGEGRVVRCREDDGMYEVELPLGNAFLRPSAVLCSVLAAEKSAYTTQRRNDDRTKLDRPDDKLVIGTQSLYLFFRLHQILCRRLGIAKRLAYEVKNDKSLQTLVEQMPGGDDAALGKRRYESFLSLVYALLDGGTGSVADGGRYEDRVRSLLGHGGYELATMDKLISHILKNVQSMANDDTMWTLAQLFRRHADAGGFKPEALRQEAAFLSDGEQMYAFQLCPVHKDGGDKSVLYMEYLGVISESEEEGSLSDPAVEQVSKRQKR